MIKSRGRKWQREEGDYISNFLLKQKGKRLLGKNRHRCKDNIKMDRML
jgi:hypothetical protein